MFLHYKRSAFSPVHNHVVTKNDIQQTLAILGKDTTNYKLPPSCQRTNNNDDDIGAYLLSHMKYSTHYCSRYKNLFILFCELFVILICS